MAWFDFEQHVVYASGQGSPAKKEVGEREQKLQARFFSVGKIERCCEKQTKTNPLRGIDDV